MNKKQIQDEAVKEFLEKEIERLKKIKNKERPNKHDTYCASKDGYHLCNCSHASYIEALDEQIQHFEKKKAKL